MFEERKMGKEKKKVSFTSTHESLIHIYRRACLRLNKPLMATCGIKSLKFS